MFCPEGFVPLSYLIGDIPSEAYRAAVDSWDRTIKSVEGNSYPTPFGVFSTIAPADSVEFDFLRHFSEKTYTCSPSGQILKLDMRSILEFMSFAEFQFHYLKEELGGKGPPDHFEEKFLFFNWPLEEYWSELENKHNNPKGLPPWKFAETIGLDMRHHLMPLYYERQGYTICFEVYDLLKPHNYMELDPVAGIVETLRAFEGWSMCVPAEDAEDVFHTLCREAPQCDATSLKGGRPASRRIATGAAYRRLYPSGHGEVPLLQVLRSVNEQTGLSVSPDTLRRAIRDTEDRSSPSSSTVASED